MISRSDRIDPEEIAPGHSKGDAVSPTFYLDVMLKRRILVSVGNWTAVVRSVAVFNTDFTQLRSYFVLYSLILKRDGNKSKLHSRRNYEQV